MEYERRLIVKKEEGEVEYSYYVIKKYSREFECDMYNVGIETGGEKKEIEDFSPERSEAVRLCEYLYRENVSPGNLFSLSEEFIVTL